MEYITTKRTYYRGMISPGQNVIFVFGSNPEGRHGAGAARTARTSFGAIYGQGEGLQGQAYALPTKDLRVKRNNGLRSIPPKDIEDAIRRLYATACQYPTLKFCIAYTNLECASLSGYTGKEMISMFLAAADGRIPDIPDNIIFSENWMPYFS